MNYNEELRLDYVTLCVNTVNMGIEGERRCIEECQDIDPENYTSYIIIVISSTEYTNSRTGMLVGISLAYER